METILVHRGRPISAGDISFIRELMKNHPDEHRTGLSRRICLAWKWTQPNGQLKDMVCRGLLLRLERESHIELPLRLRDAGGWQPSRRAPESVSVEQAPIETDLRGLGPITIRQVRHTPLEKLHNSLIAQFHYLGYMQPVGAHLKHLAFAGDRPIACFAWSSAPRHIGCRDRFISWDSGTRRKNLHLLAYNTRFLVLPWVSVPCLASHLLGKMAGRISQDWQQTYRHPIHFLETFVDTARFRGTCYLAANWIYLGTTTGRGKDDQTHKPNRSLKAVWGYPLCRDFRWRLCRG
jgi:hypothetical protein